MECEAPSSADDWKAGSAASDEAETGEGNGCYVGSPMSMRASTQVGGTLETADDSEELRGMVGDDGYEACRGGACSCVEAARAVPRGATGSRAEAEGGRGEWCSASLVTAWGVEVFSMLASAFIISAFMSCCYCSCWSPSLSRVVGAIF